MDDRFFFCPACEEPHLADDLPLSCPLRDDGVDDAPHDTLSDASATPQLKSLRAGTLVDDRYVIEGRIGEGGMGAVFRAKDLRVGRIVALKTLHGEFQSDSHAVQRFEREARVMAALNHPGVVRVLDSGLIDARAAYLVMELLTGETLADALDRERRLTVPDACSAASQVLATLSAVHKGGFVHRDLKPANVFVAEVGPLRMVKLLDFGLSRETRRSAVRLTNPGTVLGTPCYMSPALIRGQDPSPQSDVYAVATILFELLCGDLPIAFGEESVVAAFTKILNAPRRHPLQLNPDLPVRLAELLALAVSGDGHFRSAYEFLLALDETQGGAFMNSEISRLLPRTAPG
ncbi:MAG: serine/threonine protein kinase [Sandaracinaceae bacterium]|nr:serine/threonine protein kinase [Myxococcales bacterium]MCB9660705.1 serine/threonine protein kinase [Sandaracinaceae bacterium]